ncbi:hypothetical protein [Kiloniella sp.]|uniref:hypothetical protein n=1 Tax=Kiloniella sp. TaxID=1938587 RepID=UPI003B020C0B
MKKLAPLSFLSLLFLALSSSDVYAKTYKVCTVDIPGGMTADKEGPQPLFNFYQEVIEMVRQKTGDEFELQFAPALRCQNLFFANQIDIIWPYIISEDLERFKESGYSFVPIYSMPIIMGGYHIVTREEDPVLNNIEELEGKTAVSARGYGIPKEFDENANITKSLTNSNESIPKMLLGERVDAGIIQTGWIPTLREQGLMEGLHYGEVIEFWGGSFTFQLNQEGAILSNTFSNAILQLVTQGKYRDMVTGAPYYIPTY